MFLFSHNNRASQIEYSEALKQAEEQLQAKSAKQIVIFDKDHETPATVDAKVKEFVDELLKAHAPKAAKE